MAGELIREEVLEHQHGKARVRVARKWVGPAGVQTIEKWSVSISLTSTALPAFTSGDNSAIVATDTIKNTVSAAKVALIEKPWERVSLDGKPHSNVELPGLRSSLQLQLFPVSFELDRRQG